jgi:dihydroorotate dehydrogenase electron transfer subunit
VTFGPRRPELERVRVLANDRVAEGVGLMVLHAPRCAVAVRPGQFVHLRVARGADIILRRPFSVHRASEERIEILYQVLGAGTLRMAEKSFGDEMDLLGPLGTGWEVPDSATAVLLVGGGLGAAPLGMLAEHLAARGCVVAAALGAPTAERLVARELFESVCRRVEVSTDDGTAGHHGFVTTPAEQLLAAERFDLVCACGPEPMQRAVARLAGAVGVECKVSLERLMACGIGACLSCVVTTVDGRKRACVDGPVFSAGEVVWDASEIPPKH